MTRRTPSVRQAAPPGAAKSSSSVCNSIFVYCSVFDSVYVYNSIFVSVSDSFSVSFSGGQSGDKRGTVGRHCHPFFPFMGEPTLPPENARCAVSARILHPSLHTGEPALRRVLCPRCRKCSKFQLLYAKEKQKRNIIKKEVQKSCILYTL